VFHRSFRQHCDFRRNFDVCRNIRGFQHEVPFRHRLDDFDNCVIVIIIVDVCPNIGGLQTFTPWGFTLANRFCRPVNVGFVDVCPNFFGDQFFMPAGFFIDEHGDCDDEPFLRFDTCRNIQGIQTFAPDGMSEDFFGNCVLAGVTDQCIDQDGLQTFVPDGWTRNDDGTCVSIGTAVPIGAVAGVFNTRFVRDLCRNLRGVQSRVPRGYVLGRHFRCLKLVRCNRGEHGDRGHHDRGTIDRRNFVCIGGGRHHGHHGGHS